MTRPLPSLNLLRAFEAAGRTLNFRLAGEALNVTASAVSHQVRELEEQLGLPLFVRTPRALAFTPEGARYFSEVSAAMDRLRAATAALLPAGETPLKVSMVPLLDADILAPVLGHFLREHPALRVQVEADWKMADVAAGEADIGMRITQTLSEDAIPLCTLRSTLVCAPEQREALATGAPALLRALASYRLTNFDAVWPSWCAAQGWPAEVGSVVMLSNYRGLLAATAQGHGVTLGVFPFAIDWLEDGRLAAPFPERVTSLGELSLVVRDAVRRRPDVIDFVAWVRDLFRGLDRRTDTWFREAGPGA